MSFPAAGYVTMGIRYSFLGTSNRELNVYLDHDYYVSFKSTGSWDTWDTAWVNVDLAKGEETLKLISTSLDGGPNIDAFGFSLEGVCRVSEGCEESGSPNDPTAIASSAVIGSTIRLNGNSLELSNMGRAYVSVFDMQGQLKAKKIVETGSLDMSATVKNVGVYRVVVRQGSAKFSANWVKLK